jgi:hypothetical protein
LFIFIMNHYKFLFLCCKFSTKTRLQDDVPIVKTNIMNKVNVETPHSVSISNHYLKCTKNSAIY